MTTNANSANNAGIVAVELRGDLSRLESDLKRAASLVDTFGRGGAGAAGAAGQIRIEASATRESAAAQDQLANSANEAARARARSTMEGRQARRDVRQELAEIKDEIGDFSSFNGQTIADAVFGFDKAKIRLANLYGQIGDIKANLSRGMLTQAEADAMSAPLIAEADKIAGKWRGLAGAFRGIGATLVSNLASGILIGGSLSLAMSALEGLISVGGQMVDNLANPTRDAAQAFRDLGDAIKEAGGTEAFASFYGLTGKMKELVDAVARANGMAGVNDALGTAGAAGIAGSLGLDPGSVLYGDQAAKRTDKYLGQLFDQYGPLSMSKGINGDYSGQAKIDALVRQIADEFGPAEAKRFRDMLMKDIAGRGGLEGQLGLNDPLSALSVGSGLRSAMSDTLNRFFPGVMGKKADEIIGGHNGAMTPQEWAAQQREAQRAADEKARKDADAAKRLAGANDQLGGYMRELAILNKDTASKFLSAADRQMLAAQGQLDAAQRAVTDYQAAISRENDLKAVRAAAQGVARAQIGTPGQTVFERTAAYAEALAAKAEAQKTLAQQEHMRQLQARVTAASEAVAKAQRAKSIESIDENIGKLVTTAGKQGAEAGAAVAQALNGGKLRLEFDATAGEVVGKITLPYVAKALDMKVRYGTVISPYGIKTG